MIFNYCDGIRCKPLYYVHFGYKIFTLISESEPTTIESPFSSTVQAIFASTAIFQLAFRDKLNPFGFVPPVLMDNDLEPYIRQLFANYLFPKYWDCYILPPMEENTEDEEDLVYRRFFNKLLSLLSSTAKKYVVLIKAYSEKESDLLDKITSVSDGTSRYNDTPQDGGDFSDDEHTTNINQTHTETSSDYETPIKRLKEIRDNLEDCYNAWAFEFAKLFTKEAPQL